MSVEKAVWMLIRSASNHLVSEAYGGAAVRIEADDNNRFRAAAETLADHCGESRKPGRWVALVWR
jgi:hypothetical protein